MAIGQIRDTEKELADSLGYDSFSPSLSLALDQDLRIDVNSYLSDLIDMEYRSARQKVSAQDATDEQSFEQLLAKVRRMSSDFSQTGVSRELAELAKSMPVEPSAPESGISGDGQGLSSTGFSAAQRYPVKSDGQGYADTMAVTSAGAATRRSRKASRASRRIKETATSGRRSASRGRRQSNRQINRQSSGEAPSVSRKGRHRRPADVSHRSAKRRRSRHASPKPAAWYLSRWMIVVVFIAIMALTVVLAHL